MSKWSNAFLLAATLMVCLLFLEIGFRMVAGVPVFTLTDWRLARVIKSDLSGASEYDPLVGWVTKAGIRSSGFNTIAYGIRKNQASDTAVRQHGILVIGDSFAAGSGVTDEETWPALLEQMVHEPVLNAAVGGWGYDQMVLRVRELVGPTEPKIVILGGEADAILRQYYSVYGRPKPYFTLLKGRLTLHNVPVPHFVYDPNHRYQFMLKKILGYSFIADQVFNRLSPGWWYTDETNQFVRLNQDPSAVSCAIVRMFKQQGKNMGFRPMFVIEHGGQYLSVDRPPEWAAKVDDCIRAEGIPLVDTFRTFRAIAKKSLAALQANYQMVDGQYGHMTPLGNRRVAKMVAAAVKKIQSSSVATDSTPLSSRN